MFLGGGQNPEQKIRDPRDKKKTLRAEVSEQILKRAPPPEPNPVYAPRCMQLYLDTCFAQCKYISSKIQGMEDKDMHGNPRN